MKILLLVAGVLVLIFGEILRVYFIMPFSSQQDETIQLAYFINNNMVYMRLAGLLLAVYPAIYFFRRGGLATKVTLSVVFGFYGVVFYMFNFKFLADKMFLQPRNKIFQTLQESKVLPKQLVLGVALGNESKAYPIEIIGYHHQVRDTVGGVPIMVTYCTVCRTGRVFSPIIDGQGETFRLVGMDHFNAMFEDSRTKSWWRQVSGEAIVGPLTGKKLEEIPSQQMSLERWTEQHPDSKILQPDPTFKAAYEGLSKYDEGQIAERLVRKDSLSWQDKSWILGVQIGMDARAYDWIELQQTKIINDDLGRVPILVTVNPDSISFHTFNRTVGSDTLEFVLDPGGQSFSDLKTKSAWNWSGSCIDGSLKGKTLALVQSYQEYWHSWRTFRPQTSRYTGK